jgi:hypothetical protein
LAGDRDGVDTALGPGFDLQAVTGRSSGLKLVQLLARQLRGYLEVSNGRCSLRFD